MTRLVAALKKISAVYRDPAGCTIEPDEAKLGASGGGGHHLLRTSAGDLDLLRDAAGFDYPALEATAIEFDIEGIRVKFAPLEQIIEMKTRAGRPKDWAALPTLRAALKPPHR